MQLTRFAAGFGCDVYGGGGGIPTGTGGGGSCGREAVAFIT